MADNLKFGVNLEPNIDEFEQSWKKQEDKIQKIINKRTFKIKVSAAQDLDKLEAQLRRIADLQNRFAKPMTAYRAGQLDIQREVALLNQKATAIDLARAAKERANQEEAKSAKYKAQAEAAEIRLNNAKEKGVTTTQAQTRAYQVQSGVLNGLRQFMNSYLSILGAYRLVSNIKDITSEFELQRVSLRALTQDAEFADALFNKIKATAIESPFSVKQLITYTKQLAAYRIENEKLYDTMNMLADLSAGLGVDMSRLILAYGQVKAASVLRGQELRQFTEAGIPLVDMLAVKFSQLRNEVVSTGDVFELISKREVPFQMIADIFSEMTSEGGRFYQMQKKQAESLYGVYENLKDNIQIAMDEVGQANRGLLMGAGKVFTQLARHLQDIIDLIGVAAMSFVTYKVATIAASQAEKGLAISKTLVTTANAALTKSEVSSTAARSAAVFVLEEAIAANNAYAACVARAAMANNVFTRSFWKLAAAVAKNPIVLGLTALTATVVVGINSFKKYINKLSSVEAAQKRVTNSLDKIKESHKETTNIINKHTGAIKEQDILIKSQGKTLEEFSKIWPDLAKKYKTDLEYKKALDEADNKRREAINALKEAYPQYFSYLDSENFKVDQLTQGYIALEAAERAELRTKLEESKSSLEGRIANTQNMLSQIQLQGGGKEAVGNPQLIEMYEATIAGLSAELAEVTRKLASLSEAEEIATTAAVNWRQKYKKDVEPTIDDEKLAQVSLQEAIESTRKEYKSAAEELASYESALASLRTQLGTATDDDAKNINEDIKNIEQSLASAKKKISGFKSFSSYLGFDLKEQKGGGENKALTNLKNQYSLVEQIYKRYTQLQKSMSDTKAQQKINEIYGSMFKGKGGINFLSVDGLKSQLQEFQKKAEKLGDKDLAIKIGLAIQDLEFKKLKDELEKKLVTISQQISRSKAGSELFQTFLGLTGDEKIATSLTLSLTGIDVTGQDIRQQLAQQLATILADESISPQVEANLDIVPIAKGDSIEGRIRVITRMIQEGRIAVQQFDALIASIGDKDLKSKLESALKDYTNYNQNILQDFFKTINKAGGDKIQRKLLGDKRDAASSPTMVKMLEALRPSDVSSEEWTGWINKYLEAIQNEYNSGVAKLDFDAIKIRFSKTFADMDSATVDVLDALIGELKALLTMDGVVDDPTMLKSIQDLIEKASDIRISKSPLKSFIEGWRQVADAAEAATEEEKRAAKAAGLSKMRKALSAAQKQWGEVENGVNAVIDVAEQLADVLGITFSDETQDAIDGFKTGIGLVTAGFTAWAAILAIVESEVITLESLLWPLLVIALAVGGAFAAIKYFSGQKAREADKAIESYDAHIRELKRQLDLLEEVEEKLLSNEWVKNQNQQIENLKNQISDINKQIEAEYTNKRKDIDEEAVEDWKDEILDLEKRIRELQSGISKEIADTDLTSAAKEFAESWLDAYLEFGDTTEAIKSKFKEMIQSMIVNSVLARVVQQKLKPIFDYIDSELYDENGAMIGNLEKVMQMMDAVTSTLPQELESIYKNMGSWASELRSTESDLTGISKGVAQASEETVITLSGYANSILYYHVQEAADLSAIRAILEGKSVVATNVTQDTNTNSLNFGQLLSLQQDMLSQMTLIKQDTGTIKDDLAELKSSINSIISSPSGQSPKTINVKYR